MSLEQCNPIGDSVKTYLSNEFNSNLLDLSYGRDKDWKPTQRKNPATLGDPGAVGQISVGPIAKDNGI